MITSYPANAAELAHRITTDPAEARRWDGLLGIWHQPRPSRPPAPPRIMPEEAAGWSWACREILADAWQCAYDDPPEEGVGWIDRGRIFGGAEHLAMAHPELSTTTIIRALREAVRFARGAGLL